MEYDQSVLPSSDLVRSHASRDAAGMVLRQALEQSRRFLNRVGVISALEPSNRGMQSSAVTKSVDSAELANHLGVNLDNFVHG